MRVLLLSGYHSASHQHWCEGLIRAFPEHHWTLRSQPAKHFSWRVRSSGWLWALSNDDSFHQSYDLVIATSLTSVLALKAQCTALQNTPLWLYFHENQFAHPISNPSAATQQAGWRFQSIQNALCADWLTFNTHFNRDTFFAGVEKMAKQFPEPLPLPLDHWKTHSDVLPVPLHTQCDPQPSDPKSPGLIVWNHRWEWDKAPERFLRALVRLSHEAIPFQLAMLGSGGGKSNTLNTFANSLKPHLVAWGEADPETYRQWIARADLGVSTALHDFQGLSMLELAQAGARIVVPRRVAYPECLPHANFYTGSAENAERDITDLTNTLRTLLTQPASEITRQSHPVPTWPAWIPAYQKRISALRALRA